MYELGFNIGSLLFLCSGTTSSLQKLQVTIDGKSKGTDQSIMEAAAALEASVQQQQEALMKQIGGMLQSFAAERSREVSAALDGMRAKLTSDAHSTETEVSAIQGFVAKAANDLKVGEGKDCAYNLDDT